MGFEYGRSLVPRQGCGFLPHSLPFLLVVWYFYREYLATLVNKDSHQESVDSVLEKPSKAGVESRKGSFPSPVFLLFNLE